MKMQSALLEKGRAGGSSTSSKSVPKWVASSKTISNEKKKSAAIMEKMAASKEGGAGKAGRGAR